MLKHVVALLAALLVFGAAPTVQSIAPPLAPPSLMQDVRYPTAIQNAYTVNLDAVKRITCAVPKSGKDPKSANPNDFNIFGGSGTVIAHNRILTASHVIHGAVMCLLLDDGGLDAKIIFDDPKLDVAVLEVALGDGPVMPVSCDGFVAGKPYMAIGYSLSQDFALQVIVPNGHYQDILLGGGEGVFHHAALFEGRVFAGMSGGPVVDLAGRVTGIINAGGENVPFSAIRDLIETPLCIMLRPLAPTPAAAIAVGPLKTTH